MLRVLLVLCMLLSLPISAVARIAGPVEVTRPAAVRDLPSIRKNGELRVLVNQSRNSSGEVKGQSIGVEYQRLRALEQYLNRNVRDGRSLRLKMIPKAKDQLLAALQRGEGDLVAPGELLSSKGGASIIASAAIRRDVPVVIVARQGNRRYQRLEQLAGRSLSLPVGSIAKEALHGINLKLQERKLPPIVVEWVDPTLAVEDVLEMVQAGIFDFTAVELHIAERWAKVMPKLRVDRHLVLDDQGDMRWYMRRDAPLLSASVDRFLEGYRVPDDQDAAFQRVYRRLYKVHSPMGRTERQRLERVRPVLQRYAEQHDFDWLALAALAFKESTLNPSARGSSGATGLMQITPAAARSVGVTDISRVENNVQASARYLSMIRRVFFNSPRLNERERMAFVLAGYNLGPQRVQSLRAEARRRGLNPDQWFFQVERIAMEELGMGVVSYVNAVNKYYLAYARERYSLEPARQEMSMRK
ncbi:lytic transglycosylase F [Pseudomonas daroniae]|uniref:Lytic transglycosylase F n=1 Tax=Phytopseudomonas daroniae TaxID=2487519 RepID=A0A4Q9QF65_9GAMM|nr:MULTISPECIES: transglycosylase SLT domain-containing protein [Pseudomonas]TBU71606.1 lytic transglycosylase F [Pseudomonas daroniae]TBU75127.1 lytic transglycosylase F [Pseudomonas sp. FRB 228]TBU86977.1 lytic transglycosylase F [Pseudomonas daroniae]